MIKPRIKKVVDSFYKCTGAGRVAFGENASDAYGHWVYSCAIFGITSMTNVCKHDIPLDQPCSQCAGALVIHTQPATRLCNPGSGLLLTNQPVPASGPAADAGEGAAIEAGIWLVTLNATDGREFFFPVLATDGRAIELLHAGFELREMNSLEDALMAAEAQTGVVQ